MPKKNERLSRPTVFQTARAVFTSQRPDSSKITICKRNRACSCGPRQPVDGLRALKGPRSQLRKAWSAPKRPKAFQFRAI